MLFLTLSAVAMGASQLRDVVVSGHLDELRWPDFSDFQASVENFYAQGGYQPAWSRDGAIRPQAAAIVGILENAASKGLDPEDYDASRWAARMAHLDAVRFDVALTVSVMRYASDVQVGKFNPGIYHRGFDLQQERNELAGFLRDRVMNAADVRAAFANLEPSFAGYQRLEAALTRYLVLAQQDSGSALTAAKLPVEPGSPYPDAKRLAVLLRELGDLQTEPPDSGRYKEPLVGAVKRFQSRHGLAADGRIGKTTLAQLNIPLKRRVRQLQLALERWRWAPRQMPGRVIVVNIPEFELRGLDESQRTELQMKVVVGHAYRRKTPLFSADLKYVIFRPYWNVPVSITRGELLPKVAKDRNYLAANDYEVVTMADRVVTSGIIDDDVLAQLRRGTLAVRQAPGPKNSLGLVKFMFPNEYDVYLHDTPATQLFAQSRRDFSHGCIRVEQPQLLAEWILRDLPEWTPDRIKEAMHGIRTFQVDLPKPIAVLIVYATAIATADGEVHFFDDIYGFDAELDQLAAQGYPCCRWNPTSGGRAPRPRG
jgi:murein L,D-transpeptidase YcbB/YkuD